MANLDLLFERLSYVALSIFAAVVLEHDLVSRWIDRDSLQAEVPLGARPFIQQGLEYLIGTAQHKELQLHVERLQMLVK